MATDVAKKAWKIANKQAMVTYIGNIYEEQDDSCWICGKERRVTHLSIVRLAENPHYADRAPWTTYLPVYGSAWATVTAILNQEATALVCTKCLLSLTAKFHRVGLDEMIEEMPS